MPNGQPSLFTRDDTFFGVCEALGEDFGFPPNLLRVTLAVLLFWFPLAVIGSYLAAGILVALVRWVIPNPRLAAGLQAPEAAVPAAAATTAKPVEPVEAENEPAPVPLAA